VFTFFLALDWIISTTLAMHHVLHPSAAEFQLPCTQAPEKIEAKNKVFFCADNQRLQSGSRGRPILVVFFDPRPHSASLVAD
jgi:hypothetical protein